MLLGSVHKRTNTKPLGKRPEFYNVPHLRKFRPGICRGGAHVKEKHGMETTWKKLLPCGIVI